METLLTIPGHCSMYLAALMYYLRQNLLQFLHTPNYVDSNPACQFQVGSENWNFCWNYYRGWLDIYPRMLAELSHEDLFHFERICNTRLKNCNQKRWADYTISGETSSICGRVARGVNTRTVLEALAFRIIWESLEMLNIQKRGSGQYFISSASLSQNMKEKCRK